MLRNTFCHIPGIGLRSERRLWDKGILSWDSFASGNPLHYKFRSLERGLTESYEQLRVANPCFFADSLDAGQHWRLFSEFRGSCAYLDIETNGFMGERGYITAITLYDGKSVYNYVKGNNLAEFKRDIQKYKVIITYNGKCFDVPFIESHLNIRLPQAHIDLRYILKDLGYPGGLKACEKEFGIDRKELAGVDGFFAVLLWQDFKRRKNPKALETLLAYNVQDVINLEPLMVICYNLKLKGTPFSSTHSLSMPARPELTFKADMETIERIFSENSRFYQEGSRQHPAPKTVI